MRWKRKGRNRRDSRRDSSSPAAWHGLEPLESRQLMAATLIGGLDNLYVSSAITSSTVDLGEIFNSNTVVEFDSVMGTFFVELTDGATPLTVTNFLDNYVSTGKYTDSFVHRSVPGFVIQGGGFTEPAGDPFAVEAIVTVAPVMNEFSATRPNVRGSIAMAKTSDPNSATSQWFVNLADNASLDNPANSGGFTVFGHVIGDGMDIVDAIAAEPVFDKQTELANSAMGELPLTNNYVDGDPVARDNLVLFNSIEEVPGLVLTVVSNSNPDLVTATIDELGQLQLDFATGVSGQAEITVRATDLEGGFVEDTFTIIRDGRNRGGSQTFTDETGTPVAIQLVGPGRMEVRQLDGGRIDSVVLNGTTRTSKLLLTPRGGGSTEVGDILVTGSLDSLKGKSVDLGGDLRVTGVLKRLHLRDVADDHTIAITATGRVVADITFITLGRVSETTLTSGNPIVKLHVTDWNDDNDEADLVTAPWIRDLIVHGDRNVAGDFEAGLNITGASLPADQVPVLLVKAKVAGALRNAAWAIARGVGSIAVDGGIFDSSIRATQSINSLAAGRLVNATVFAGISSATTTLPTMANQFTSATARIGRLAVPGLRGSDDPAWVNSFVASAGLGPVNIGKVATDNGDTEHGLASRTFKSIAYTDAAGAKQKVTADSLTNGVNTDDDFTVRVV